jgi:transcription termination factor Rho
MSDTTATVAGTFEADGRGGGALRRAEANYRVRPDDPRVPLDLVSRSRLRGGESVQGVPRDSAAARGRRGREIAEITTINGLNPDEYAGLPPLEELTAIDPREPMRFETPGGPLTMRVVDLLTPIGRGQRGLIVSPPRTGKTILLQHMAAGVAANYPDVYIMVLLVDERPEEVTEMRRNVPGEVVASSNDQDVASHVRVARLMINRAKRMVECGRNVLILLDSLTRLGRAFNNYARNTGRIMSGGLDAGALREPKAIFGAARNVEGGGSLTIMATALIDTGSRMDQVIFNEFKGTGNMEIMLSRDLANKRIWPAIDLAMSGTRKEELLLEPDVLAVAHRIRRELINRPPEPAMQLLLEKLGAHPDNKSFVASLVR